MQFCKEQNTDIKYGFVKHHKFLDKLLFAIGWFFIRLSEEFEAAFYNYLYLPMQADHTLNESLLHTYQSTHLLGYEVTNNRIIFLTNNHLTLVNL